MSIDRKSLVSIRSKSRHTTLTNGGWRALYRGEPSLATLRAINDPRIDTILDKMPNAITDAEWSALDAIVDQQVAAQKALSILLTKM